MNNDVLIEKLTTLIAPIVNSKECELYHIEFVKEDGENFLRIYIDNSEGVTLENCEQVSRAVSAILDTTDPIEDSYYLEVSSPGIFRTLFNDNHLNRYKGSKVSIKLSALFNEKKQLEGILQDFNESEVIINMEEEIVLIPREKIDNISLNSDI
jgi:ribosome maturation factor RimP